MRGPARGALGARPGAKGHTQAPGTVAVLTPFRVRRARSRCRLRGTASSTFCTLGADARPRTSARGAGGPTPTRPCTATTRGDAHPRRPRPAPTHARRIPGHPTPGQHAESPSPDCPRRRTQRREVQSRRPACPGVTGAAGRRRGARPRGGRRSAMECVWARSGGSRAGPGTGGAAGRDRRRVWSAAVRVRPAGIGVGEPGSGLIVRGQARPDGSDRAGSGEAGRVWSCGVRRGRTGLVVRAQAGPDGSDRAGSGEAGRVWACEVRRDRDGPDRAKPGGAGTGLVGRGRDRSGRARSGVAGTGLVATGRREPRTGPGHAGTR